MRVSLSPPSLSSPSILVGGSRKQSVSAQRLVEEHARAAARQQQDLAGLQARLQQEEAAHGNDLAHLQQQVKGEDSMMMMAMEKESKEELEKTSCFMG